MTDIAYPQRYRALERVGSRRGILDRLPLSASDEAVWVRPSFLVLLLVTTVIYTWNLSANGWGNSFYAAAVQAGTKNWTAFFFGSFDSSNFITVDKPPASLWVMELSARLFGLSSWSLLVPQALEGVAAVALLFAAVRRMFGPGAGLLAGCLMALSPVAVLMFRFDNPDALLVLLMTAAAYCGVRALERGDGRWLMLAGSLLGFGFLTKMMQALLILPALGIVYLISAPISLPRRLVHLLGAGVTMVIAAGWWIVAVLLTPAGLRPYVGGSTDNSPLQLALGYNGLSRIFGQGGGPAGGGGGGANFSGTPGIFRLFNSQMGTQIAWLLPAAAISLVACMLLVRWKDRGDKNLRALLLWGSWLTVTAVVFSFSKGVIHTYYTVALVPPLAATVAVAAAQLWDRRSAWIGRIGLSSMAVATGIISFNLLDRTPNWYPELRYAVLISSGLIAIGFLAKVTRLRVPRLVPILLMALTMGGAQLAYGAQTAATTHSGSIPVAGPYNDGGISGGSPSSSGPGGNGALPSFAASSSLSGIASLKSQSLSSRRIRTKRKNRVLKSPLAGAAHFAKGSANPPTASGKPPSGTPPSGAGSTPSGSQPKGIPGGPAGLKSGSNHIPRMKSAKAKRVRRLGGTTVGSNRAPAHQQSGSRGAGPGAASIGKAEESLLKATTTRWAAATVGSQEAGSLELSTDTAIMAIGGFTGSDPVPSLNEFEAYVRSGEVRYFISGGMGAGGAGGGFPGGGAPQFGASKGSSTRYFPSVALNGASGGSDDSSTGAGPTQNGTGSAITQWVEAHFKKLDIGGQVIYDLTQRSA